MNDKQINAYRQMKAPEELKNQILEKLENENVKNLQRNTNPRVSKFGKSKLTKVASYFSSVAAVAVIMLVLLVNYNSRNSNIIMVQGEKLGTASIVLFQENESMTTRERASNEMLQVALELTVKEGTTVSVSEGMVYISKDSSTIELFAGDESKLDGTYQVLWTMSKTLPQEGCRLTMSRNGKNTDIIVNFNQKTGKYEICKK